MRAKPNESLKRARDALREAGARSLSDGPGWLRELYRGQELHSSTRIGELFFGWDDAHRGQVIREVCQQLDPCLQYYCRTNYGIDADRLFDDGLLFVGLREVLRLQGPGAMGITAAFTTPPDPTDSLEAESLSAGLPSAGKRKQPFLPHSLLGRRLMWLMLLYALGAAHRQREEGRQRWETENQPKPVDIERQWSASSADPLARPPGIDRTDIDDPMDQGVSGSEVTLAEAVRQSAGDLDERALVSSVIYVAGKIRNARRLTYWQYTYRQRKDPESGQKVKRYVPVEEGFYSGILDRRVEGGVGDALKELQASQLETAARLADEAQLEQLMYALADSLDGSIPDEQHVGKLTTRLLEGIVCMLVAQAQCRLSEWQHDAFEASGREKPDFDPVARLLEFVAADGPDDPPMTRPYDALRHAKDKLRDDLRALCADRLAAQRQAYRRATGDGDLLAGFLGIVPGPRPAGRDGGDDARCRCLERPERLHCSVRCQVRGIVEQCSTGWSGAWGPVVTALTPNRLLRGRTRSGLKGGFLNRPPMIARGFGIISAALDLFVLRETSARRGDSADSSAATGRLDMAQPTPPDSRDRHPTDQQLLSFSQLERRAGRPAAARADRDLSQHIILCAECAGRLQLGRQRAAPRRRTPWEIPADSAAELVRFAAAAPRPGPFDSLKDRLGRLIQAKSRRAQLERGEPVGNSWQFADAWRGSERFARTEAPDQPDAAAGTEAPAEQEPRAPDRVVFELEPDLNLRALAEAARDRGLQVTLRRADQPERSWEGWQVSLRLAGGAMHGPVKTDSDGRAFFPDLAPEPSRLLAEDFELVITPPRRLPLGPPTR